MRPATTPRLLGAIALAAACACDAGASGNLGASSCSTSGCHGGAGELSSQFVTWSQRDVHSRTFAVLTTSRSARMAETLSIPDPAASMRCVVCHAPLATAEPSTLGAGVDPAEGVSCSSCHNAPDGWLRGHTRADWTHSDRVAAGMRDLNDLYTRANTCVACHQNIDPELIERGHHPALVFELDGQTQGEPRHWTEHSRTIGAQAWYVGQAVALREVSWALLNGRNPSPRASLEWASLGWLLERSGLGFGGQPPGLAALSPASLAASLEGADSLAKRAAQSWDPAYAGQVLRRLAGTKGDFADAGVPQSDQAYRAERLVLALDRLLAAMPPPARPPSASARLDSLFRLAQSIPDFDAGAFARELGGLSDSLSVSASTAL